MIPAEEVPTELAREAIPAEIPLADAVANVSAVARLVLGLRGADLDLLARGLEDRIHQPRRRELYPRSMELVDAARRARRARRDDLRRRARPSWSGPPGRTPARWLPRWSERCAGWAEVRRLPFDPQGADVPEL